MTVVGVVGSGAWPTAIAHILSQSGHEVLQWCHRSEYVLSINQHHQNLTKLPDCVLTHRATDRLADLQEAEAIVFGVPSAHYALIRDMLPLLSPEVPILSLVKGMTSSGELVSLALQSECDSPERFAVLSGPNLAKEIAQHKPAATVIASEESDTAHYFQKLLSGPSFRVYTSDDVVGVSWGGTLKNVMAIAAGAVDGAQLGDNAKAALITRGLQEMTRFATHFGAQSHTLTGLAGLGDLITTCQSPLSRNYQVGLKLAQGHDLKTIHQQSKGVMEGIETIKQVAIMARKNTIEMPITDQLYGVLFDGSSLMQAIESLMLREAKSE